MTKKKIIALLVLIVVVSVSIIATISHRGAIISGDADVRELEREMERMVKEGEHVFDEEGELTDSGAEFLDRIGKLGERKKTPPWMLKRFASRRTPSLYRHMLSEIIAEQKDPAVVDTLIKVMLDKKDNETVRGDAAFTLGMIGDERAIDPLIEALQDESEEVRINVLRALGMFEDERAIEPLLGMLKSEDSTIRSLAVRGLKIDNEKVVASLIDLVRNDPDVRTMAIESLGEIGTKEAVKTLLEILEGKDIDSLDRSRAAIALGKIGDSTAFEPLIKILEEDKGILYRDAAEALAQIGDKRALGPIKEVMARKTSESGRRILQEAYNTLSEK